MNETKVGRAQALALDIADAFSDAPTPRKIGWLVGKLLQWEQREAEARDATPRQRSITPPDASA